MEEKIQMKDLFGKTGEESDNFNLIKL